MFCQKTAWDVVHDVAHCDKATNHQLSIAAAFWIIRILSAEECSSLTQNLMQSHCSTQSFWLPWPHSTYAHSVCLLPPRTSTVKSSLLTHAHSSPLSLAAWLHPCHANRSHYINWLAFFWTDLVFEMFVLSLHLKDNLEGIKFFSPTLFFSVLL